MSEVQDIAPRPATARRGGAAPATPSLRPPGAAAAVRGRSNRKLERATRGMGRGIALSLLPGLALFAIFFAIPLGVVLGTSFSDWGPIEFEFSGLENYSFLMSDPRFWAALRNTALFSAAAVLIQVPVGIAVAVILSRRIRGWRVLRTVYFLPNIVSAAALALVYVTFFNPRYGLLNQLLGTLGFESSRDWLFDVDTALPAVAATWVFTAGIIVILVMAEIAAIPDEVYDAARVDGATRWQITRHITLPLLRNITGVCLILVLLFTLAYFDGVYVMTNGGPADRTITLSLYAFQEYSNSNWGYANAIGALLVAFGLVVILTVRRVFRIGERDF